jgi:hypothetical protein
MSLEDSVPVEAVFFAPGIEQQIRISWSDPTNGVSDDKHLVLELAYHATGVTLVHVGCLRNLPLTHGLIRVD